MNQVTTILGELLKIFPIQNVKRQPSKTSYIAFILILIVILLTFSPPRFLHISNNH